MLSPILSRRGVLYGLAGAAAVGVAGLPRLARAETDTMIAPRPVLYDRTVGELTVTALLDGYFPLDQSIITGADAALIGAQLTAAHMDPAAPIKLAISTHLIRTADGITLIDAGAGAAFGPTSGKLAAALAAAGVAPEAVTRVVLTHMHPDHIGGMMAGEAAAFPKATVHVSNTDLKFWTDEAIAASVPDGSKPFFALARAVAAAYGDRMMPFDGDADLGGGLRAMALPGHTPGHTGYHLSSGKEELMIIGDAAAMAALQFSHPEIGLVFDADPAQAIATRKAFLAKAASDKIAVAATHLPFPGFGHIDAKGDAFAWVPEEWQNL